VLRAGHTGITALINPYGRVMEQLPTHTRNTLLVNYARISETTVYTQTGDWAVLAALVVGLVAAIRGQWRRRFLV
jgi:apolipoprotein N-acyltransferase